MRYIDAEALTDSMLEHYNELCEKYGDYDHYTTGYGVAIDAIEQAPTADVAPRSEVAEFVEKLMGAIDKVICEAKAEVAQNKDLYYIEEGEPPVLIETSETRKLKAKEVLSNLKRQIHDRAVYPNCHGVEPYISLKVFDAVINKFIGS